MIFSKNNNMATKKIFTGTERTETDEHELSVFNTHNYEEICIHIADDDRYISICLDLETGDEFLNELKNKIKELKDKKNIKNVIDNRN